MQLVRTVLILMVLALASSMTVAQVGGIRVTVHDPDGLPLPGATVTVSHDAGFVKTASSTSDGQGVVEFPVLRAGRGYTIEASFPGLGSVRYPGLAVEIGADLELALRLTTRIQEQVRVGATRDVVDLDAHENATRFNDEFIQELPVPGRFYQNILTMAPGVQDADGDGNPNVHGARSRDFQAVVSGVSNVDPLTGHWMSRVNPNSIEALEIISAGAGVEFGGAQGGFARIVQKQGSNTHEGVFELYWQTSKLDKEGARKTSGVDPPDFETIQPLLQMSGPLVRDRLWYRVSFERRDREEPINTLSRIAIYRESTETQDAQLTWQASPRNKLAFQFRSNPVDDRNFGLSSSIDVESSQRRSKDAPTYSATWTASQSPHMLVESTVAWQDAAFFNGPTVASAINSCIPNAREPFLHSSYCLDQTVNQVSGPYFRTEDDRRQRFTVKSQATVHAGRFLGASHQLKSGLEIENERYFRSLTRAPSINYDEFTVYGFVVETFGVASTTLAIPESDDARATATRWAMYLEDRIKPSHNVTVTLGARVDREEMKVPGHQQFDPVEQLGAYIEAVDRGVQPKFVWPEVFTGYEAMAEFRTELQAAICDDFPPWFVGYCHTNVAESILSQAQSELKHVRAEEERRVANTNFSPYVAFSWSPGSDGKTAFKATAGRHYNRNFLVIPLQEVEPPLTDIDYRVSLSSLTAWIIGGIESKLNVTTVDQDLKTPYADELTFAFERELWPETSLRLTRIDRKFRDQIQDVNVNRAPGDYGTCLYRTLSQPKTIVTSPGGGVGSGILVSDPLTGEIFEDTDPGPGDGRLDDCLGNIELVDLDEGDSIFGLDVAELERPDGIPDAYVQNPFWGDIMRVGNNNQIDYEAWVLELTRRQYRNWQLQASYTWSRAVGDGEDFFQELGNDPTLSGSTRGYQSYDQRHVAKLNAATITPWGIRLGTALSWQSGLPYSVVRLQATPDPVPIPTSIIGAAGSRNRRIYPTGSRNDQRNPSYWNVDLKVSKELRVGQGLDVQLSAEVFNVLNDSTFIVYNPFFERGELLDGTVEGQRRFGRRWQLGMRVAF